jgi:hypothetical protein
MDNMTLAIVDRIDDEDLMSIFNDGTVIYVKPGVYAMSDRKLESLIHIAEIQRYYQCNPVRFIEDFFNITLLDAQAYIVARTWNCPNVLVLASRAFGKSTVIDLMLMAKDMLFCNIWSYIASGSGSQAEQTFTTLERLANDGIDEFRNSTGYIFKNEVEINNASGDGFSHGNNGFKYSLYNGSFTQTLNSNIDKKRGMRGNVIFDECGFLSEEMLEVYGAFAAVNKGFASGKDRNGKMIDPIRLRTFATNIPNQKFYISSASSTDTKFYRLYREFSKRQIMGDRDYCVVQVPCDIVLKPTIHGEVVNALLKKSDIETAVRTNPEKARREYYCEFTSDAGNEAIIRRGVITRNSETRVPLLYNDTNEKKFVLCFDPARSRDNSIITVMEIYTDRDGYKGRIVNCVNMIDVSNKRKAPMQTPDQVDYLRQLILDYNGDAPEYKNIEAVLIDAGAGGAGKVIADMLMQDWVDHKGKLHHGLIDKETDKQLGTGYSRKYPNAIDKVKLLEPSKYKSIMYESAIEMTNSNFVNFTADYDNKGYLTLFQTDDAETAKVKKSIEDRLKKEKVSEEEFAFRLKEELKKSSVVKSKMVKLDPYQEIALANIDALKEELVNMRRIKRDSGKDSFELIPEKVGKLHDDRAYTYVMASYWLSEKRMSNIRQRKKPETKSILDQFKIRAPQGHESIFG